MKRWIVPIAAVVTLSGVGLAACGGGDDDGEARPRPTPVETVSESTDAVSFWQARVDADRDDALSRSQLAGALLGRALADHNTIDAITADDEIDAVLATLPNDTSALLVKAQTRMFVHDFGGGAEYAQRVLDKDPTNKSAIAIAGDAAFELGDLDAAAVHYDALAARIPGSPEVFARSARLAFARGAVDAAIAQAEQASAAAVVQGFTPEAATYYDALQAELLRLSGQYEAAGDAFRRVLAVNDEDGPAIEGLGKVYAALGDLDEAEKWWTLSGELIGAPDFHVLAELGDIEHARGNDAEASAYWEQALDAVTALSEEERIGFLRDESRFRAARGLDAAEALRLAEQDFGIRQDALAYDTLAWAQLAAGDVDEAVTSIERALAPGLQDAGIWYHAAEIYAAARDTDQARTALEHSTTISPNFDLYEAAAAAALANRLG